MGNSSSPKEKKSEDEVAILKEGRACNPKVTNGDAFDFGKVQIDFSKITKVVVPKGAKVDKVQSGPSITVHMRKSVGFAGHPPGIINPQFARKAMGCCYLTDGDTLQIGAYGFWDSRIEGSADIDLRFEISDNFEVKHADNLEGDKAISNKGLRVIPPKYYWYGPTAPTAGWTKIESEPDISAYEKALQERQK
eukprot:Phypoly_transcript_17592.p1 GENE.Phypoly_transcript_17592~~Phypoly_transcript_17592.p1  ORF type:complete len:205 (+),score=28.20 Phypoly_transcript_17592:38-616(+)